MSLAEIARAGRATSLLATLVLLCACQAMVEKRNQRVRASADILRLAPIQEWDPLNQCRQRLDPGKKQTLSFTQATPVLQLPGGIVERALCVELPYDVATLQVQTIAAGGFTYDELAMVYPSLLFLDAAFVPIGQITRPRMWYREGWTSQGLIGTIRFDAGEEPRFAVLYLDRTLIGRAVSRLGSTESLEPDHDLPVPTGVHANTLEVPISGEGALTLEANVAGHD